MVEAKHDVLVIGAGCAGMRAAIEAFDAGADVAIISKLHPTRSHSGAAEGGINAALGNASEDNPEIHAFDTVKGADYLGDQDAIEILCNEAPGDVYELENWGAVFSRTDDGRIAQRPFGAAGAPRTAYAADITGHVLLQVLYEQLMKRDLRVYEEWFAWKLVVDDDRCQGVICWDIMNGGLKTVGGAREDRAPVLELVDVVGRLVAEDLDRVLVAEVVRPLDRVEGVLLRVVLGRVPERGVDASLGRAGVASDGMDLRDDRHVRASVESLDRRAHSRAAGADDQDVVPRVHHSGRYTKRTAPRVVTNGANGGGFGGHARRRPQRRAHAAPTAR